MLEKLLLPAIAVFVTLLGAMLGMWFQYKEDSKKH